MISPSSLLNATLATCLISWARELGGCLFRLLIAILCRTVVVKVPRHTAIVDQELAEHGWTSCVTSGRAGLPSVGTHLFARRGLIFVAQLTVSATYVLYVLRGADRLTRLLNGEEEEISVREMTYSTATRRVGTLYPVTAPKVPYPWQHRLAVETAARFAEGKRASLLLYGGVGGGKSRFAEVLAVQLRAESRCEPVISILDLTARGATLEDALRNPQPTRPVILLIDEIETAIAQAERNVETRGDAVSLARNRPALLRILDRLEKTWFIVVVATTNANPADLEEAYVRKGRFDRCVEVSGSQ